MHDDPLIDLSKLEEIDPELFTTCGRALYVAQHFEKHLKGCFKILVREEDNGAVDVLAFEIPESVKGNENPAQFMKSVRDIEQDTGLRFMSELPADVDNKVETEKTGMW
jgi:hypothetical protein